VKGITQSDDYYFQEGTDENAFAAIRGSIREMDSLFIGVYWIKIF
jgi:hypothetical protein